jgi:signal transduction histidine kinase
MGLMLAKTFARMSGGELELRPGGGGKGMVVSISLPLAAE